MCYKQTYLGSYFFAVTLFSILIGPYEDKTVYIVSQR